MDWTKIATENYELAEEAVRTNYHGSKELCTALIPLLQLSDSPTIVMLTSLMGTLQVCVHSNWPFENLKYFWLARRRNS